MSTSEENVVCACCGKIRCAACGRPASRVREFPEEQMPKFAADEYPMNEAEKYNGWIPLCAAGGGMCDQCLAKSYEFQAWVTIKVARPLMQHTPGRRRARELVAAAEDMLERALDIRSELEPPGGEKQRGGEAPQRRKRTTAFRRPKILSAVAVERGVVESTVREKGLGDVDAKIGLTAALWPVVSRAGADLGALSARADGLRNVLAKEPGDLRALNGVVRELIRIAKFGARF